MPYFANLARSGANDTIILEDEDYDIYDGYEQDTFGLTEKFCNAFDFTL